MEYFNYDLIKEDDRYKIIFPETHPLVPGITIYFYNYQVEDNIFNVIRKVEQLMERAEKKRKHELYAIVADNIMRLSKNAGVE